MSELDPMGWLDDVTLKRVKSWGLTDLQVGEGRHLQIPTSKYMKEYEPHPLKFSDDTTTYTIQGDTNTVASIIGEFDDEAEPGDIGAQITVSRNSEVLYTINVTAAEVMTDIHGKEHEDDVDYGSDGEGNIDYDDWTMQKHEDLTKHEFKLVWEPATLWPPFMDGYGRQLIDPACLAAYKHIANGGEPGDVVTISGLTMMACEFTQPDWRQPTPAIPPPGKNWVLRWLLGEKRLVYIHSWSNEWVVSKKRAESGKIEDLTDAEKAKYMSGGSLKTGLTVSTVAKGNSDGDEDAFGNRDSKTYTVTRTWTYRILYTNAKYGDIPTGLQLVIPQKNPNP